MYKINESYLLIQSVSDLLFFPFVRSDTHHVASPASVQVLNVGFVPTHLVYNTTTTKVEHGKQSQPVHRGTECLDH